MVISHPSVRVQESIVHFKPGHFTDGSFQRLLNERQIVGMDQSLSVFCCWPKAVWIQAEDAKMFERPVAFPRRDIPRPAACVAQFLRLGQARFTPLKFTLHALPRADVAEINGQTFFSGIKVPLKPFARRSRGGPFKMNRNPVVHRPAKVLVKFRNDARWRLNRTGFIGGRLT